MGCCTGKLTDQQKLLRCKTTTSNTSESHCAKTNERLQAFIEYFVHESEAKLLSYHLILEGDLGKSGKFTEILSRVIGVGTGGIVRGIAASCDVPEAVGTASAKVVEIAAEQLCCQLGNEIYLKKVMSLVDLIDRSQKDKANFRKTLVEAGFDIFQSFEMQFVRVTADKGPRDAMHNLAKDAANRAINYIKMNKDALISEGVVLGKSAPEVTRKLWTGKVRSGFKITYEYQSQRKNWYTASLYEKVGLSVMQKDKATFFKKRDSTRNTPKYGYRRLLSCENWSDLEDKYLPDKDEGRNSKGFKDYKYVLSLSDLQMEVERLLKKINDCDKDLAEVRIKEILSEAKHDILEEIRKRSDCEEHRKILAEMQAIIENLKVDELLQKLENCLEEAKEERKEIRKFISEGFQEASEQRQEIGDSNKTEHGKTQAGLGKISEGIERVEKSQCELNESVQTALGRLQRKTKERIWFNLRESVDTFTGRQEELDKLISVIKHNGTVAICGLSGVGKSELAIKYARNQYSQEGNVIWINAGSRNTIRQSFHALCRELGCSIMYDDGVERDVRSIAEEVYLWCSDRKSLFIFDDAKNYDKIRDVLPLDLDPKINKPDVLITCSNLDVMIIAKFRLRDFKSKESINFIRNSLGVKDGSQDNEIEKLANRLHNFPLALQQAVTYVKEQSKNLKNVHPEKKFMIRDYLEEYERKAQDLLNYEAFRRIGSNYDKTTFTALQMTLDKIKDHEHGQEAFEILCIMAYLAPDNIPAEMFLELVKCDEKELGYFIQLLKEYSVVRYEEMLNIHGLIQQIIRFKLQEENEEGNAIEEIILSKVLEFLKKCMVDSKSVQSYTPHILSVWDYAYKYDVLLEKYINRDVDGKAAYTTYFHLIAEGGRWDVVQHVLNRMEEKYPNDFDKFINQENHAELTPLHSAASSGNEAVVKLLIGKGAHVNAGENQKRTPLHFAAKNGHIGTVKCLLNKCADINAKTLHGYTPLHFAVKGNFKWTTIVLLSRGADVNAKTNLGFTPLHYAANNNSGSTVRILLNHKASVDDKNGEGYTPLHLAAKRGRTKILDVLLQSGANVEAKTPANFTPLHLAAENDQLSAVQALLRRGAMVDGKDENLVTPLHVAAMNGHADVVKTLLERTEDINAKTIAGYTPLDLAAEKGHLDVVKALTEREADATFKNIESKGVIHNERKAMLKKHLQKK